MGDKFAIAHARYTTDECSTLRAIANDLKIDYWRLRKRAKDEDWHSQRLKNLEEIRAEIVQAAKMAVTLIATKHIQQTLEKLHDVRMASLDLLQQQLVEAGKPNPKQVTFEDTVRYEGMDRYIDPETKKVELRPWIRTVRSGLPRPDAKAVLDFAMQGIQMIAKMAGIGEYQRSDAESGRDQSFDIE